MTFYFKYKIIIESLIFLFLMSLVFPTTIFAVTMSSSNFSIEGGTINAGGSVDTSSLNFSLQGAFGEVFVGQVGSSNFQMVGGAQNFISPVFQISIPTPPESIAGGGIISQPAAVGLLPSIIGCNGADFNNDGLIDLFDFGTFIFSWQSTSPSNSCIDINGDGVVDIVDFGALVFEWTG